MKNKKIIFFVLMFLPLVVSGICLFFLPDEFPSAVSGLNLITTQSGMASKYNVLIFPVVCIFIGALFPYMAKTSQKKIEGKDANTSSLLAVSTLLLAFFNILNIVIIYIAAKGVANFSDLPFDIYKVIFIFLGILMVIIGNIMPKVRMNSVIGIRTAWSMKDEETWKASQRFGGIATIIEGAGVIIAASLTKGSLCVGICLSIFFFMSLIEMYGSFKVCAKVLKQNQEKEEKK